MQSGCSAWLAGHALWEMARYDIVAKLSGFAGVRRRMRPASAAGAGAGTIEAVCEAVGRMSAFYWKPLLCLQRSVVTARLLRSKGIEADVVIGFRANPFFSHAWVEVGGEVINDSAAYQRKLQPLDRF
jgi:hypothetical protein